MQIKSKNDTDLKSQNTRNYAKLSIKKNTKSDIQRRGKMFFFKKHTFVHKENNNNWECHRLNLVCCLKN